MTEIKIKDASNGDMAAVSERNRLRVQSESWAEEAISAIRGEAYIFHADCETAAASSGGFLYIKNIGNAGFFIAITRVYFDAHTLTNPIRISQIKNPATVSGGTDLSNSTEFGIIQKNFGQPDVMSGTARFVASVGSDFTYTGGQRFHHFKLASGESQQRNMRATNIIAPNTTWALGWDVESGSAVDGETVGISVNAILFNPAEADR